LRPGTRAEPAWPVIVARLCQEPRRAAEGFQTSFEILIDIFQNHFNDF
jgi:hypothetical protein